MPDYKADRERLEGLLDARGAPLAITMRRFESGHVYSTSLSITNDFYISRSLASAFLRNGWAKLVNASA